MSDEKEKKRKMSKQAVGKLMKHSFGKEIATVCQIFRHYYSHRRREQDKRIDSKRKPKSEAKEKM